MRRLRALFFATLVLTGAFWTLPQPAHATYQVPVVSATIVAVEVIQTIFGPGYSLVYQIDAGGVITTFRVNARL